MFKILKNGKYSYLVKSLWSKFLSEKSKITEYACNYLRWQRVFVRSRILFGKYRTNHWICAIFFSTMTWKVENIKFYLKIWSTFLPNNVLLGWFFQSHRCLKEIKINILKKVILYKCTMPPPVIIPCVIPRGLSTLYRCSLTLWPQDIPFYIWNTITQGLLQPQGALP